ncbi:undecaprenyl-diphosphatase [Anaerobacillus sp. MEB173]|uniref:undecaprenyl-diphosphatase n=1 Tax=Anaerobacillus sp. MEB173 TaxID=3383345 RepID=UPI003F90266B
MDQNLFHTINGLAGKNSTIDQLMMFISSYFLYVLIFLVLSLLFWKSTRKAGAIGGISILFGLALNLVIAQFYYRDRPFVESDVNLLIEKGISASFPSDQATIGFICAFVLLTVNRKMGSVILFLAILLGFSRVYVGHHYPLDVLGGFVVAAGVTFLSLMIGKKVLRSTRGKRDVGV